MMETLNISNDDEFDNVKSKKAFLNEKIDVSKKGETRLNLPPAVEKVVIRAQELLLVPKIQDDKQEIKVSNFILFEAPNRICLEYSSLTTESIEHLENIFEMRFLRWEMYNSRRGNHEKRCISK